jgi:hypothetical protein
MPNESVGLPLAGVSASRVFDRLQPPRGFSEGRLEQGDRIDFSVVYSAEADHKLGVRESTGSYVVPYFAEVSRESREISMRNLYAVAVVDARRSS